MSASVLSSHSYILIHLSLLIKRDPPDSLQTVSSSILFINYTVLHALTQHQRQTNALDVRGVVTANQL